jgi:transposase InsO family protein
MLCLQTVQGMGRECHRTEDWTLRDDKGGEYMSREFDNFCIDHGIQRQHTARNHPQQNGVAKRANRMIEEGIICMLHESGMPPSFWGEALASFIHISNRITTSTLSDSTLTRHSLGLSQMSLGSEFEAAQLMFSFRETSVHLAALECIWRSVSSLDILMGYKA